MVEPVFVESTEHLDSVVDRACARHAVALDTEFLRTSTYYPILGLVQLFDGDEVYLIDPFAGVSITPLGRLFRDPETVKVLHACSEDMEVFQHALGVLPRPLFDTQTAAAMLGDGYSLSYQAMVERETGVTIPKDQTRSDWTARPLTVEQIQYAALDVSHLLPAYETQVARLGKRNRWVLEECDQLLEAPLVAADPARAYLRVKSAWRLTPPELHVLRALCVWREELARKEDRPRSRIADDAALMAVARDLPVSRQDLARITEMHARQVRRYGDAMLEVAARASVATEDQWPGPLERPAPANSTSLMKRLKVFSARRAAEVGVNVELLARRKHLEALLRSVDPQGVYQLPAELGGWRRELIGDALVALANEG